MYLKTLLFYRANKNKTNKTKSDEEESEGLALLIPDIQQSARIVHASTSKLRAKSAEVGEKESDSPEPQGASRNNHSLDQIYMDIMKDLQFGKSILLSIMSPPYT